MESMDRNLVSFLNNSDVNQEQHLSHFEVPKWTRTLQLVFMVLLCGGGLLGNGLVAIIQTRLRNKSSTDFLVLTMALLDLFCSTCVTPIYMAQNIHSVWDFLFSSIFCKMKYFLIYGTNISSTMLFSTLAFDRYMRTCHPFSSLYTCTKAKIVCVIIILISFSMASTSFHVFDQNEALNDCIKVEDARVMETIMNSCLTGAFVLLFGMVVVCYTKITLKIRKRAKARNRRNDESSSKSRPCSRNFRLFKSKKVEPLPLIDETHSSGNRSVSEPRTSSAKKPDHDSSGSCSADSANDVVKTRIDLIAFATRIDRQVKNTSANLTLTPSALKDLTPRQNNIYSALHFKENIPCSPFRCENNNLRHICKGCQRPRDVSCQHQKKDHNSQKQNYPRIKQQKQQQVRVQQFEDNSVVSEREKKEIRKINYVTFMMFIITGTYVITWVSAWLLFAIFNQTTVTGRVVLYLTRTSFTVNYIANPVFFTLMSARFRERAKNLICCRK